MPVAEVRGARIAYDDTGGSGPPVVLAHGFLMDRSMFAPQVEALAATHRVVCWDGRGWGDTEYDGAPFTYWDSAADCLGLMDHLGIDRAVVGGMSQGGFVSLRVALTAPQRVRGLILIDTQSGPEEAEVMPLYQGMLDEWAATGPSQEIIDVVAGLILGPAEVAAPFVAKWRSRPHAGIAQPGATLMTRDDVTDRLGEIAAPALVLHGDADAAIAMAKAQALAAGLPGADDVVVIHGGSHAANLTHPAEANTAIAAFLADLPG